MGAFLLRALRVGSLVLFAAIGCVLLMRYAPGYFSDTRELDASYARGAREQISTLEQTQGSLGSLLTGQLTAWSHGDLGRSRHFDVPVTGLIRERTWTSASLLLRGVGLGWLVAVAAALPLSARKTRRGETAIVTSTAMLLALPAGVLAVVALLCNVGGPVLVLALLVAARDFKLLYRLMRTIWRLPMLLHARAQGFTFLRTVRVHLLPVLAGELLALAMMSFIVALSALVPLEVVFNLPGLGQLAWSAALNRDLPVLVAVTALLAGSVGLAELFTSPGKATEVSQCA